MNVKPNNITNWRKERKTNQPKWGNPTSVCVCVCVCVGVCGNRNRPAIKWRWWCHDSPVHQYPLAPVVSLFVLLFFFSIIFSSLLFSRSPNFFFGDGDSAPFYFFLKSKMEPIQRREKARNCPREDENKENETKDSTAMNRLLLFPFFLAIFALCFGRKQNGRPHLELMNDGPWLVANLLPLYRPKTKWPTPLMIGRKFVAPASYLFLMSCW